MAGSKAKQQFAIYGNCQGPALARILMSNQYFAKIYEPVFIDAVWLIKPEDDAKVQEIVRNLSLFIYQPIGKGYGGPSRQLSTDFMVSLLKPGAESISIPVAYFTGYNPETIYLKKNEQGDVATDNFCDYHDLNILKAYIHGMSWERCVSYIQGDIYPPELLHGNVRDTLTELRRREAALDVKVSDFIEHNWRGQRLFFSCNHPANAVLTHEAHQIFQRLGLPCESSSDGDYIGETRLIIYPAVRDYFGLNFNGETMRHDGKVYSREEMVRAYYSYYEAHFDLVDFNMKLYAKSPDATLRSIASTWNPLPFTVPNDKEMYRFPPPQTNLLRQTGHSLRELADVTALTLWLFVSLVPIAQNSRKPWRFYAPV